MEADVATLFEAAVEEFGRVDAVLNVAGIGAAKPITEVTMDDYDAIMNVDLRGVLLGMKYGIPAMIAAGGGSIVNWSSVGGLNASSGGMPTSVYNAAKAGVISVTKSASAEYGHQGIRANAICPGFIETEIMGASGGAKFPEMYEKASLATGREARGGGPGRRVPVLRPRLVRQRCDHPGRRRLVRPASLTHVAGHR